MIPNPTAPGQHPCVVVTSSLSCAPSFRSSTRLRSAALESPGPSPSQTAQHRGPQSTESVRKPLGTSTRRLASDPTSQTSRSPLHSATHQYRGLRTAPSDVAPPIPLFSLGWRSPPPPPPAPGHSGQPPTPRPPRPTFCLSPLLTNSVPCLSTLLSATSHLPYKLGSFATVFTDCPIVPLSLPWSGDSQ